MSTPLSPIHQRYLGILGVPPGPPSLERLRAIVRAHLERIPFENLSKLYYLRTRALRGVPDLPLYLDGIERHRFGGTCYSNNPYLYGLLDALGYDVTLCAADMSAPDVHIALTVRIDGREYLVDVGYGAPFFEPLPRDLDRDVAVRLGDERFVLAPQDGLGRSAVHHERGGERIHGYVLKPEPRRPEYFEHVIIDSFRPDATFMTRARVVTFRNGTESVQLSDLTLIHSHATSWKATHLPSAEEALRAIDEQFGIAPALTRIALAGVGPFADIEP